MTKIEHLKAERNISMFYLVIFSGITLSAIYLLAMAWINQNFLLFVTSGALAGSFGWITFMQFLAVIHQCQKVGREELRMGLEENKRRFDIKF